MSEETPSVTAPTVRSAIDKYLSLVSSTFTGRTYGTALRHLQDYFRSQGLGPDTTVDRITPDIMQGFIPWLRDCLRTRTAQPTANRSTLRTYLAAASGWYGYCVVQGNWVPISVMAYEATCAAMHKAARVEARVLAKRLPPDALVAKVLDFVRGEMPPLPANCSLSPRAIRKRRLNWLRDRALVETLLTTGMRVSEAVSLRRSDLLPDQRAAEIRGKGYRHRIVFFSEAAWAALQQYLQERDGDRRSPNAPLLAMHWLNGTVTPMNTRGVQRTFERLAKQVGEPNFHLTPHTFRHWYATRLLHVTQNIALVQRALGHSSPTTTQIYATVLQEDLRRAHRAVFDGRKEEENGEEKSCR